MSRATPPWTVSAVRAGLTVVGTKGNGVELVLEGVLVEPEPHDWLIALLTEAAGQAASTPTGTLVLDVRKLAHVNASSFRALARWFGSLNEQRSACNIVLKHTSDYLWQRVSVPALTIFGGNRLKVIDDSS